MEVLAAVDPGALQTAAIYDSTMVSALLVISVAADLLVVVVVADLLIKVVDAMQLQCNTMGSEAPTMSQPMEDATATQGMGGNN
mmetsp:Transcript_508/g.1116  ORF Transcript_508/g.1116 Transcript_508/m.1116 type:complete len:84 (-) Transcript_508:186-437(-)